MFRHCFTASRPVQYPGEVIYFIFSDEGNNLNEFPFIVYRTRWGQSIMNFISPSVLCLAQVYEAGAISDI
jgi:hypothetical protein